MAILGPQPAVSTRPASAGESGMAQKAKNCQELPKDGSQSTSEDGEQELEEQVLEEPAFQLERVSEEEGKALKSLLMCDDDLPYWQNLPSAWSPANKKDVDLLRPTRTCSWDPKTESHERRHFDDRSPDNVCDMFEPKFMGESDFKHSRNLSDSFSRVESLDGSQKLRESIRRDLEDLKKEEEEGWVVEECDRTMQGYIGMRGGISVADLFAAREKESEINDCNDSLEESQACDEVHGDSDDLESEQCPNEPSLSDQGRIACIPEPAMRVFNGKHAADGKESSSLSNKADEKEDASDRWAVKVSTGCGPSDSANTVYTERTIRVRERPLSCIPEGIDEERSNSVLSQRSQSEKGLDTHAAAGKGHEPTTYRGNPNASATTAANPRTTMSAPSGAERPKRSALPAIFTHGNSQRLQALDQSTRDRKLQILNEEKEKTTYELASRPLAIRSINTLDGQPTIVQSNTIRSKRMGPQSSTLRNTADMFGHNSKAKHDVKVNVVALDFSIPSPPQIQPVEKAQVKGRSVVVQQKPAASSGGRQGARAVGSKTMHTQRRPMYS